jgi:toxin ParE1/3/4
MRKLSPNTWQKTPPLLPATVVRKILASTRSLASFPFSGRRVPEFDDESLREVFAFSYRVIYRIESDLVIVAAVIHGKRMI